MHHHRLRLHQPRRVQSGVTKGSMSASEGQGLRYTPGDLPRSQLFLKTDVTAVMCMTADCKRRLIAPSGAPACRNGNAIARCSFDAKDSLPRRNARNKMASRPASSSGRRIWPHPKSIIQAKGRTIGLRCQLFLTEARVPYRDAVTVIVQGGVEKPTTFFFLRFSASSFLKVNI